jgi:hypothetical protein
MARRSRKPRAKEPSYEAKLRKLARLQLARADIDLARRLSEAALAADLDKREPAATAYFYAVVVTYGRPFKNNESVGALERSWNKFADPQLQVHHEHFLTQRDQAVAHSELRWHPLVLAPAGTRLPNKVIAARPKLVGARIILDPGSYVYVVELCADLVPRLTEAFDELFVSVFPDGIQKPIHLLRTPEGEPGVHINLS